MRVAALYDIHGNLPALEAVLQDVGRTRADQIVVGGDVVPGPMPRETLQRLLNLDLPVQFIHGNCELAILALLAAADTGTVTYWGTTSGKPLPEPYLAGFRWTAQQLEPDYAELLAGWPKTLTLEVDGLGKVLFCHSSPRSETEIFTRLTPGDRLLPLFKELNVPVVVCGNTHMQFDQMIGITRLVNAGSVGQPFGAPGAYWALLGPGVQLQHTSYDIHKAAERIRATPYPLAQEEEAQSLLHPPSELEMLEMYSKAELK